jgi:hypothetical protein
VGIGRGRGRVAVGGGRWEAGEAGAKLPGCSEGLSPSFLCYFSGFFFSKQRRREGERRVLPQSTFIPFLGLLPSMLSRPSFFGSLHLPLFLSYILGYPHLASWR